MTKEFDHLMDIVENGTDEEHMLLLLAVLMEKSNRVDRGEWNND